METAIKKAIEGGWELKSFYYHSTDKMIKLHHIYNDVAIIEDEGHYKHRVHFEQALMSPLFWQALGKAEGWTFDGETSRFSKMTFGEFEEKHWKTHWHRFIDWIAEGKGVDEFFTNLLK